MAQRTRVDLIDDIDGTEASDTVTFALDGVGYEIDLSDKNAQKLRDAVAPYVAAGRKVSSGARRQVRRGRNAGTSQATAIRQWAQSQGLNVSSRGRVSAEVREAYDKAHR